MTDENQLAEVDLDAQQIDDEDAASESLEQEQETAEAETTDQDASEETTDEPPKPDENEDLKKKIDKLERRQLYLQRQLEKEQAEKAAAAAEKTEEEQLPAQAPNEADYNTYEEYRDALEDWKIQKALSDYDAKQKTARADTEAQQEHKNFIGETVRTGIDKYDDFEDVALAVNVPMTDAMIDALKACENPADIAYHLGSNLNVAASIARMDSKATLREITKIDMQFAEGGRPPKPKSKTTNAPPPIKRKTGSGNVVHKDPEKMSQAEYEAWRAEGGGRG